MTFAELGLGPAILKAVEEAGYVSPTPIQEQAIPIVLTGRDVLGVAQTGTGKTASFVLPMIEILAAGRAKARMPRSLILEPTRELAAQVAESFEKYGKYNKLTMALLIGGNSFGDQEKALDRGVDVLIATPGRLMDLFDRGRILLSDCKILVIDEADRMLDMGFIPDVERIVGLLPKIRQTLFFSATMPPEIRRLADAFLSNPKQISVSPPASTATAVQDFLVTSSAHGKRDVLRHILRIEDVKNALIFCNRKRDVDILYRSLLRDGFDILQLHGDMPQSARTETLERFRKGEVRLLACSDVAARELDISGLSHVFNYDVPHHADFDVHRIGRTGRAGREGRAFTIATAEDGKFLAAIVRLIGREIPRMTLEGVVSEPEAAEPTKSTGRSGAGRERGTTRRPRAEPRNRAAVHAVEAASALPMDDAPVETTVAAEEPPIGHKGPVKPARESAPVAKRSREPAPVASHVREPSVARMSPPGAIGFGDHLPDFIARSAASAGRRRVG